MHMLAFFHCRHSRTDIRRAVASLPNTIGLAGALAGLGGGFAMALIGILLAHALDQDLWLQMKVIASLVLGPAVAAQSEFVAGPILLGTLIHMLTAALLGALFEVLMRRIARLHADYGIPEVDGLVYGLLIWLLAFFIIIPAVSPLLFQIYAPALLIQHLIYGAVTGLLYAMLRPPPYASIVST